MTDWHASNITVKTLAQGEKENSQILMELSNQNYAFMYTPKLDLQLLSYFNASVVS